MCVCFGNSGDGVGGGDTCTHEPRVQACACMCPICMRRFWGRGRRWG